MNIIKKINKKLIVIISVIIIGFAGINAFAAAVLGTDIITLIQKGIASIEISLLSETENEINQIGEKQQQELDSHIQAKAKETIAELKKYQNGEINRANTELNEYTKELKSAVDSVIESEKQKTKNKIKDKVDDKKEKEKEKIENKLIDSISNHFQINETQGQ
ncbi:hypothetical protein [Tepidibacter mesophilus]|uniref:hypothetical protein n=1 Tax=Tepidibacter mesophilus TaxID=655607 RepID=UPI0016511F98|nr:hypothetical protein [Tepidibacter mesophilus]